MALGAGLLTAFLVSLAVVALELLLAGEVDFIRTSLPDSFALDLLRLLIVGLAAGALALGGEALGGEAFALEVAFAGAATFLGGEGDLEGAFFSAFLILSAVLDREALVSVLINLCSLFCCVAAGFFSVLDLIGETDFIGEALLDRDLAAAALVTTFSLLGRAARVLGKLGLAVSARLGVRPILEGETALTGASFAIKAENLGGEALDSSLVTLVSAALLALSLLRCLEALSSGCALAGAALAGALAGALTGAAFLTEGLRSAILTFLSVGLANFAADFDLEARSVVFGLAGVDTFSYFVADFLTALLEREALSVRLGGDALRRVLAADLAGVLAADLACFTGEAALEGDSALLALELLRASWACLGVLAFDLVMLLTLLTLLAGDWTGDFFSSAAACERLPGEDLPAGELLTLAGDALMLGEREGDLEGDLLEGDRLGGDTWGGRFTVDGFLLRALAWLFLAVGTLGGGLRGGDFTTSKSSLTGVSGSAATGSSAASSISISTSEPSAGEASLASSSLRSRSSGASSSWTSIPASSASPASSSSISTSTTICSPR